MFQYTIRDKQLLIKATICVTFVVVVFFLHAIPELRKIFIYLFSITFITHKRKKWRTEKFNTKLSLPAFWLQFSLNIYNVS